jgi:hypothetical protein
MAIISQSSTVLCASNKGGRSRYQSQSSTAVVTAAKGRRCYCQCQSITAIVTTAKGRRSYRQYQNNTAMITIATGRPSYHQDQSTSHFLAFYYYGSPAHMHLAQLSMMKHTLVNWAMTASMHCCICQSVSGYDILDSAKKLKTLQCQNPWSRLLLYMSTQVPPCLDSKHYQYSKTG